MPGLMFLFNLLASWLAAHALNIPLASEMELLLLPSLKGLTIRAAGDARRVRPVVGADWQEHLGL